MMEGGMQEICLTVYGGARERVIPISISVESNSATSGMLYQFKTPMQ